MARSRRRNRLNPPSLSVVNPLAHAFGHLPAPPAPFIIDEMGGIFVKIGQNSS
jgi:hypothetical protein